MAFAVSVIIAILFVVYVLIKKDDSAKIRIPIAIFVIILICIMFFLILGFNKNRTSENPSATPTPIPIGKTPPKPSPSPDIHSSDWYRQNNYIETTDDKNFHIEKPQYHNEGAEIFVTGALHNHYKYDLSGVEFTYDVYPSEIHNSSLKSPIVITIGNIKKGEEGQQVKYSLGKGKSVVLQQLKGWLPPGSR